MGLGGEFFRNSQCDSNILVLNFGIYQDETPPLVGFLHQS